MSEASSVNDKGEDDTLKTEVMESRIEASIISLTDQFKEQAESLTLEGIARLLEEDMGLEPRDLDDHKGFIKKYLAECFEGGVKDTADKIFEEKRSRDAEPKRGLNGSHDKGIEDSPVHGLVRHENSEHEDSVGESENAKKKIARPTKNMIREALLERTAYIKENSEKITMAGVRRFLEGDIGVAMHVLDPYKKYITEEVDKILSMDSVPEIRPVKDKKPRASPFPAAEKKKRKKSGGSDDDDDDDDDDEREELNEAVLKQTKRKRAVRVETRVPKKSKQKVPEEHCDADDCAVACTDIVLSRDPPAPYGKRVDQLKSIIKACGMSISPAVYRRVKQVDEGEREACMIRELEGVLSREGLTANPSEKEMKEVKKRKQREKELEGIDASNIVSSTRRRRAAAVISPPPQCESEDGSSGDGSSGGDNDDGSSGDDDNKGRETMDDDDDDGDIVEE